VRGIAALDAMRGVARTNWSGTPVSATMRPLSDDLVVAPDTPVFEALQKASRNGVGRLAVIEHRSLVGYLSLEDVTHALVLEGERGARAADRAA
jgi:CBS domain-containing protein